MEDALDIKHKVMLLDELLCDLLPVKNRWSSQFYGKYSIAPQYNDGMMYLTIWNDNRIEIPFQNRTDKKLYYPRDELVQEFFEYYSTLIENDET